MADWIESQCIVPDGDRLGDPFFLTDEQLRFLLNFYRLDPTSGRFAYYGSQLRRAQKWGKDPFAATVILGEGLGPALPAGWDADGEPVGRPWRTPWIQCAAVSEDQTDNTFRPIFTMLTRGPLADLVGLDPGETRVNLPDGGKIEPVTSAGRSRLGQRLTFGSLGETHLWVQSSGGLKLAANMRRNTAGMGGRWMENTNAYDPAENSVAQRTAEAKAPGVYIDDRPGSLTPWSELLADDAALRREVIHVYGDSIRHGDGRDPDGWVDPDRIMQEIHDPATDPADAQRFFGNRIVVGSSDLLDPLEWERRARTGDEDGLEPGDVIALGFDGSKGGASKGTDGTALWASRLSDARLFRVGFWQRPAHHEGDWYVSKSDVLDVLERTFDTYVVPYLFADPWKWQDEVNGEWAARWPDQIVAFPTNVEQRMDAAIDGFLTAFRAGEITHDGDMVLTQHVHDTALTKGSRKKPRPGEAAEGHYLRLVKKNTGHIDATVAAVLAHRARAQAIEDGWSLDAEPSVTFA
jgi:hypothetical protein